MLLGVNSFNHWGVVLLVVAGACGLDLLVRWYWREAVRLRARLWRARRIREWRARMAAMADRPFDLRLLTAGERRHLVGRDGLDSEQWARAWAADFIAGRRDCGPTCGDYLREFGEHPKVRAVQH